MQSGDAIGGCNIHEGVPHLIACAASLLLALGRMIGMDFSSLHLKSKNCTGAGTMLDEYYTPEAIDLVRLVYVVDFETVGYSRDLPEQCISAPLSKRAAGKGQSGVLVLSEAGS
jgi:hypothetical protein